ncbi:MAG: hypothetical protein VKL60_21335 [Sphaerospermopsis sp.]|nr:hypothetical protein [Sphaerospermopsis sp.]
MIADLKHKFNGKVYFLCDPRELDNVGDQFQHLLVCLAEGFRELGISFFANVNYWLESPRVGQLAIYQKSSQTNHSELTTCP